MYDYAQHKTSMKLEAQLDNNSYDETQLVELKIPMHLPYQSSRPEFERYNGEIELNGTLYKYVKRKVANDTLFLMCIPNTKKMHLETAKNDFFKLSNDLAQNTNSKKTDKALSVFKDLTVYNDDLFHLSVIPFSCLSETNWLSLKKDNLPSRLHISPEQPPDALTA